MSPFKEAHQFNGVPVDKALMDAADALEKSGGGDAHDTSKTVAAMRAKAKTPHTHHVSMKFSDGKVFDVQEDASGQYLVLDREVGAQRTRCYVGSWIVKMPSGKFAVFSNEDYLAMGGAPETK